MSARVTQDYRRMLQAWVYEVARPNHDRTQFLLAKVSINRPQDKYPTSAIIRLVTYLPESGLL